MLTGPLEVAITGEMPLRELLVHPSKRITDGAVVSISGTGRYRHGEQQRLQYKIKLITGNTTMRTTRGGLRIPVNCQSRLSRIWARLMTYSMAWVPSSKP